MKNLKQTWTRLPQRTREELVATLAIAAVGGFLAGVSAAVQVLS